MSLSPIAAFHSIVGFLKRKLLLWSMQYVICPNVTVTSLAKCKWDRDHTDRGPLSELDNGGLRAPHLCVYSGNVKTQVCVKEKQIRPSLTDRHLVKCQNVYNYNQYLVHF